MNYTVDDVKRAAGQALLAGIEAGVSRERDRIIALVESGTWSGLSLVEDKANLIALIKGENK